MNFFGLIDDQQTDKHQILPSYITNGEVKRSELVSTAQAELVNKIIPSCK